MAHATAICPECNKRVGVNDNEKASLCNECGAPFVTQKGIDAFNALDTTFYVTVERENDPIIRDSITFVLFADGRPRPLANNGYVRILCDKSNFEIPVFITDSKKITFEGVLKGEGDGSDIKIVWAAEFGSKPLGRIKSTTNGTVCFEERPGIVDSAVY